jgi:radical SAM protein with 4Fe4S-binding SPASM domain
MTEKRQQNSSGFLAPALFSFITLRQEAFGGILFNPFLSAEVELDKPESFIAGMCTGQHVVDEICEECQTAFGLTVETAARKWDETLAKLNSAFAVQFIEKTLSRTSPPPKPVPRIGTPPFTAPKTVIWDVTYACDLSCPHCLTNSGRKSNRELDTKEAFRLIDILASAKILYLSLTGGEPFARSDILELLTHLADTSMRVDIATNGFHVSPKIIKCLRHLPVFQVQVSLDGIGEQHDRFRGREGAFENACQALRRFKDEGLSTSINTTATAQNIDLLGDLIDLAVELGCDAFKAIPFIPAGRGKQNESQLGLDRRGSLKLTRVLAKKSRELAGRINISTESTFLFLLDPPIMSNVADGRMICSAGYDELSVGADGTAYPCPFLHDFPLGNLLTDSIARIWHESTILNDLRMLEKRAMNGPCRTCEYAPEHCCGGCRASAFLACGDLKSSDPLCFRDLLAAGPTIETGQTIESNRSPNKAIQRHGTRRR